MRSICGVFYIIDQTFIKRQQSGSMYLRRCGQGNNLHKRHPTRDIIVVVVVFTARQMAVRAMKIQFLIKATDGGRNVDVSRILLVL